MHRKDFIKNSLLATGTILLPNAIWAFDKKVNPAAKNLNKFISKPNLNRFKVSQMGTKFFETELSIQKPQGIFKLNRKYFISENITGICTPTLLEINNKESLVFIPELYNGNKHNGYVVKVYANGLCEETKIFTHENQGYYAFWGKEYLGQPTLYHYNKDTFHLMRMHKENEQWINHRVMPLSPTEMIAIYQQQLQNVEHGQLTQQYGYDFDIHKDGFYEFLALKNGWEQSIITKEKETYEKENPSKIFTNQNEVEQLNGKVPTFKYTDAFIPIYCKGDDLSYAVIKPTIIYEEVAGTKIEIANMPACKTQDDFGDCRAFSLATIMQKHTCDKWSDKIADCKNPTPRYNISSFGMMVYTNKDSEQDETFQPLQKGPRNMYHIIEDIAKYPIFILESCKPFSNLVGSFSSKGQKGLDDRDKFFVYLQNLYNSQKAATEANVADCTECLIEISNATGMDSNFFNLKKALAKDSYDKFLYTLFFDGCEFKDFADGYEPYGYPNDATNATSFDVKNKIIEGLKKNKPVLFPKICMSTDENNTCTSGHSIVISGYKRVLNGGNYKDVFKVHNSWGGSWQKEKNDGWVDADAIVNNSLRVNQSDQYASPASVIWLEQ